ncbi:MAG: glycosyltransferase family 4 protein [archaeon]
MKILMMGLTPPLEGGSERHIYEISSRLKDVTVLTQSGSDCRKKIEIPVLNTSSFIRSLSFFISAFIYSIYLVLKPRKEFDLVHIHENLLYFLVPLLKMRYRVLVTVHGIKGFKFYEKKFLWIFFKSPLMLADGLIAVSKEDQGKLNKFFKRVTYIPNGVDTSTYSRVSVPIERKITFIGRIHEQKGIKYLLEAFKTIARKKPDFKLEIIGNDSGMYAQELKHKFKNEKIDWKGFISDRNKIARSLKSAYCIVLPSLWEGLPLTLFEAMASGRPVVVSDIDAIKSVVEEGDVSFVKSKNSEDIALRVIELVEDKKKAGAIGKRGATKAKEYDWKFISNQLGKTYISSLK